MEMKVYHIEENPLSNIFNGFINDTIVGVDFNIRSEFFVRSLMATAPMEISFPYRQHHMTGQMLESVFPLCGFGNNDIC